MSRNSAAGNAPAGGRARPPALVVERPVGDLRGREEGVVDGVPEAADYPHVRVPRVDPLVDVGQRPQRIGS